jgi:hypothetical protein
MEKSVRAYFIFTCFLLIRKNINELIRKSIDINTKKYYYNINERKTGGNGNEKIQFIDNHEKST